MPSDIWRKLNLKKEPLVVVLNAPESFDIEVNALSGVQVARELESACKPRFVIAFVTKRTQIEEIAKDLPGMAPGDVTVWFSYPKSSSKRYTCDFSRDTGWDPLGAAGFEAVRQVAIDEDWSAIRFRRVDFIQKMKRDPKRALTEKGKGKSTKR